MQRYIKVKINELKAGIVDVIHKSITKSELHELKKQTRNHAPVDWSLYSEDIKHIVFYTELRDYDGNPYYADIYLPGVCIPCTDEEFTEHYQKPRMYVIAKHRK